MIKSSRKREAMAVFLVLLFAFCGFTQEIATKVSFSTTASAQLLPDTYLLSLTISATANKEATALSLLGKAHKELAKLSLPFSGGKFYLDRNCLLDKGTQKCQGFKATAFYEFQVQDPQHQATIFETLSSIDGINFAVQRTEWIISPARQEKAKEELMLSLIDKAKTLSDQIGKKLNKSCTIESISYQLNHTPILYAKAQSLPEPTKEPQTVSITANISLICR
jgi:uncharacterized protein YggE